ncbi:MAG TPA: chemotaxis protein CheW [Candidatus Binatia bacterium]|jgi:purine-binding chemotaxis protein CheW|nr:chemotaxis protein CheW [Candidatus Binatia bacterium]
MSAAAITDERLAELRRSFDEAFARPPAEASAAVEDLLFIRVGGDPYAVRLRELTGLAPAGRIAPVPGPTPELLGLATVRGALVPTYDLTALLGYPRERDAPAWLLLCDGDKGRVALGVVHLERHGRIPAADVTTADDAARREHVSALVRSPAESAGVVDVRSLIAAIARRLHAPGRDKE